MLWLLPRPLSIVDCPKCFVLFLAFHSLYLRVARFPSHRSYRSFFFVTVQRRQVESSPSAAGAHAVGRGNAGPYDVQHRLGRLRKGDLASPAPPCPLQVELT